jgi:hypothetical protein
MKVGDLVTFSSYGEKLDSLYKWTSRARRLGYFVNGERCPMGPLVGMVISVKPEIRYHACDTKMQYDIRWIGDGPKGRNGHFGTPGFYRKDLKFISKAK